MSDIRARRLRSQRLVGAQFASAVDAVRWFGAVQSQDYPGASWALGLRTRRATAAAVDRLLDDGAILRTHVLRPTWHVVLPEDVRWLLELTGPRVRRGLAGRRRQLEIDSAVAAAANAAFESALAEGRHRTRVELAEVLRGAGIPPDGPRLAHLLIGAELDGLIVSGRRRAGQHTYALLAERAPQARALEREEAIAELTLRYLRSHGPAQVQDLVWWSGMTVAEARAGISLGGAALEREVIDGREHWSDAAAAQVRGRATTAHLLPNFDEYTVAYRDRSAVEPDSPFDAGIFSFGSVLSNVVAVDGRVRGAWRRSVVRSRVRVDVRLLGRLEPIEAACLEEAVQRLGRFLRCPAELIW